MKIAITGVVGTGKTSVSQILRESGYHVFDSDDFSKRVVLKKTVKNKINKLLKCYGRSAEAGDYKNIGRIFDENKEIEDEFEKWYQPYLGRKIIDELEYTKAEDGLIFCDIPNLIKKGIAEWFDIIWLVTCGEDICVKRIKTRNNYSQEKIDRIINDSKEEYTDFNVKVRYVENQGHLEQLRTNIEKELHYLNIR